MSDLEIEKFAAKLILIWRPQSVGDDVEDDDCLFYALIKPGIYLEVEEAGGLFLYLNFHTDNDYLGCICAPPTGVIEVSPVSPEQAGDFESVSSHWRALFRRNCWLSGWPIECTEHEKWEWTLWLQEQDIT